MFEKVIHKYALKSWTKSKAHLKFKNFKWKNDKPLHGSYNYTNFEQLANILTHGLFIIPAIIAASKLFERSHNADQYLVAWVYGCSLTMLFIISTFFHCSCYNVRKNALKPFLHRVDRAMIYIFIASSYFPWLQLANDTPQSYVLSCLEWAVWLLAALGIAYQQLFHERFKWLETVFYVIMGLGPALGIIVAGYEFNGMTQLKIGGFLYIFGITFFKADGIFPFAHAIWHIFVLFGAGFHYYAILYNLFPLRDFTTMQEEDLKQ